MSEAAGAIRPRPEDLKKLPTLAVETRDHGASETMQERAISADVDYRLELKLVTAKAKYWLCTQGADGRRPGVLDMWIVGNVTVESLVPNEGGEFPMYTYGPQDTKRLQGIDYYNLIAGEIELLAEEQAHEPTPERKKRLDEARKELTKLLDIINPPKEGE